MGIAGGIARAMVLGLPMWLVPALGALLAGVWGALAGVALLAAIVAAAIADVERKAGV